MSSRSAEIKRLEERNLKMGKALAKLCEDRRAEEVLALDMRKVCDFTDVFILATANSGPQMKGLARDIEKEMRAEKMSQLARHGLDEGIWAVLDYGDIVVHVQTPEARMFYRLEELWSDAPHLKW